jgi:hypothetical protein
MPHRVLSIAIGKPRAARTCAPGNPYFLQTGPPTPWGGGPTLIPRELLGAERGRTDMRRRISSLAALLLLAVTAAVTFPPQPAQAARPHVQSASLVRSGGFAYYRRVLATVGRSDGAALAALSALLPARLPAPRRVPLCADCRTTRLELVVGGRAISYVWDASPPRSLRRLVAALVRHG